MTIAEAMEMNSEVTRLREEAFTLVNRLSRNSSQWDSTEQEVAAAIRMQDVANHLGNIEMLLSDEIAQAQGEMAA